MGEVGSSVRGRRGFFSGSVLEKVGDMASGTVIVVDGMGAADWVRNEEVGSVVKSWRRWQT